MRMEAELGHAGFHQPHSSGQQGTIGGFKTRGRSQMMMLNTLEITLALLKTNALRGK